MKVWNNGRIETVSNDTNSLNYAMHYGSPCVWEGMRNYTQTDGSNNIFGLEAHIERLLNSGKIMGFDIPFDAQQLIKASNELVEAIGGGDLYLRPIAYSENSAKSAKPQTNRISVKIYAFPIPSLHSEKKGIRMGISSYTRGYPQFQMQAKTAANYHFLQTVKHELDATGYDDVFLTDNQGYITEATVANVIISKKGELLTPPDDGSILPGITRETLMNSFGIREKRVTRADLYTADAVMLCGTYAEVVNVLEIDGRDILDPHGQFNILKNAYSEMVRNSK